VGKGFEAVRQSVASWCPRTEATNEPAEAATVETELNMSSVRVAKRPNAQIQRARAINQRITDQSPLRALRWNR